MQRLILSLIFTLCCAQLYAQQQYNRVAPQKADSVIESIKSVFPKFYREYKYLLAQDSLIKEVRFIDERAVGPAFASPKGIITFNIDYLKRRRPAFDDNRLIVVLYHETGHLHYYMLTPKEKWTPEESEKAAFEYSLLKTSEMVAKNDCLPLAAGLKFMKLRSESNDTKDPHVRALKRMVTEPLYASYLKYLNDHCNQ
ncbi:hypothetical protein [Pedobacter aquatilis]|uniref:hypothetical protein n=1 Tax=Pedobacter aquatilis TaxID=351343 RepID=UPI00293183EA|nr:hypothetical protein [Pedobacter aquatilis]